MKWKALSLTHVEYAEGDLFGYVLAWFSLLPIFISVSFVTLILFRRDLHTVSYFVGLILNEAINWFLKHVIKEERPIRGRENVYTVYGMPSSHAQFMSFLTLYLALFLYIRVHHNTKPIDNVWKHVALLASLLASILVCYSRVYLSYHTSRQVQWGVLTGSCFGFIWFLVVHNVFTPYFPSVASWRVSELLMVRDSSLIRNVLWFEYCSHRVEARSRLRKTTPRKSM